ncbi:MAG: hypothetical protein JNJ41_04805 [Bacteroidia bacterium]|nr:hypothetical protein [Bacteroidia bacterium]
MIESSVNNNFCVLVMSCDKYHDLWSHFFYFFDKYWKDCPYPVYLATNSKSFTHKNVKVINSNCVSTWSEETAIVLDKLPHDYIIYLQDDYFILDNVNTIALTNLCSKFVQYKADYLRLFPIIGPDSVFKSENDIGLISKNASYRTSLQAAIWRKESLKKLLVFSENQWEFESNSPSRSGLMLFLSINQQNKGRFKNHTYPIKYYYLTAVLRGKWRRGILNICKREGVVLDLNYRKPESYGQYLYQSFYDFSPTIIKKCLDIIKSKLIKSQSINI